MPVDLHLNAASSKFGFKGLEPFVSVLLVNIYQAAERQLAAQGEGTSGRVVHMTACEAIFQTATSL